MELYIFVFTIALIFYYQYEKFHYRVLKFTSLLILILFAGFRYKVGSDYISYWWIYQNINTSFTEPGYRIICKLLSDSNFGAQAHFLLFSAATLIVIERGINFYCKSHATFCLLLYLFLGFYIDSFNIVRQSLSIAIYFWSGKYIVERNIRRYLLCILLASCFHYSAFILVPFYYILNRYYSKALIVTGLVFSIVLYQSGFVGKIIGYLPIYMNYLEPGNAFNVNSNLGLGFLMKYVIGIIFILSKDKLVKLNPYATLALNSYFCYLILTTLLQDFLVFTRIGYYFQIFLIVALPIQLSIIKRNGSSLLAKNLVICYCLIILYVQTSDSRSKLIPYNSNFDIYQKEIQI